MINIIRIIGGTAGGRKLYTLQGMTTRPTTDRTKESLFGIIAFDLPGCTFLDLFGGSGSIGLEAVSRGADSCVICENDRKAADIIRKNIAITGFSNVTLMNVRAEEAIKMLASNDKQFDMVYIDPPYLNKGKDSVNDAYSVCMNLICEYGILNEGGIVMLEHSQDVNEIYSGLKRYRLKEYGLSNISFYRNIKEII